MKTTAKILFNKRSTEDLFDIIQQPPETCPMIDGLIESLETYNENLHSYFLLLQNSFIFDYEECLMCYLNEYIEDFNLNLEDCLSQIDEKMDKVDSLIQDLNIFRKNCEALRENGSSNKELLWKTINSSVKVVKNSFFIKKNKSGYVSTKIDHHDFYLSFSNINQELILFEADDFDQCAKCTLPSEIQSKIALISRSCFKDETFNDAQFDKMKKNYELLFQWCSQIQQINIEDKVKLLNRK